MSKGGLECDPRTLTLSYPDTTAVHVKIVGEQTPLGDVTGAYRSDTAVAVVQLHPERIRVVSNRN